MAPFQEVDSSFKSENIEISKKEILYDGNLYDVSTFIHRHPGGEEIIQNFMEAGEDATLAIQQFHNRSIDKVLKMMKALPNRPEPQIELSKEMEVVRKRNAAMTSDFVKLFVEIRDEGLFEPDYTHWRKRWLELLCFITLGFFVITHGESFPTRLFGSFILAMSWGRAGWMGHELGHMSGTGNPKWDINVQAALTGFCQGWSAGWWRRHHNLHHALTNRAKVDPDLNILPNFLVYNLKIFDEPKKEHTIFQRFQVFFVAIYSLMVHLRWQFWETTAHLINERDKIEIISILGHYWCMYQIGFQMWFTTVFFFASYLFGNTILSHSFVPVTTEPTHWIERSFSATINVEPSVWCDWWMGFLNYQIEHHLFPTLPQFRSPLIVKRVKALAEKYGLPYYVYSYKDAVIKTLQNIVSISHFLQSID